MTETGTTTAWSSKFCDVDTGLVMDGCSYLNVEATSLLFLGTAAHYGQQFLETVNRSLFGSRWEAENKSVCSNF